MCISEDAETQVIGFRNIYTIVAAKEITIVHSPSRIQKVRKMFCGNGIVG
jgi:hypothetical protein